MIELSEQELCALDACVDVASEGPPSFVIPAQRAVRKLRYPQAFDRAKAFQHSYRDIMPSEVSVDYVKASCITGICAGMTMTALRPHNRLSRRCFLSGSN